jgi:hypothetical protein
MTEENATTTNAGEIVISSNEQFAYWCEFLKRIQANISSAEKTKDAVKEKIKAYRDAQNEEAERGTMEVVRLARARVSAHGIPEPAVATNMVPDVAGIHYRTRVKWRVKNHKAIPREYLIPDEKTINSEVKKLGMAASIRGIDVYEDSTPVPR